MRKAALIKCDQFSYKYGNTSQEPMNNQVCVTSTSSATQISLKVIKIARKGNQNYTKDEILYYAADLERGSAKLRPTWDPVALALN